MSNDLTPWLIYAPRRPQGLSICVEEHGLQPPWPLTGVIRALRARNPKKVEERFPGVKKGCKSRKKVEKSRKVEKGRKKGCF